MSMVPETQEEDADGKAERQADAMRAQLRKDVDTWSTARRESSPRQLAESVAPASRQPSLKPVGKAKKSNPATPAVKPADSRSKPFSMSYDGGSTAEYIQYMIDRGAR